MDEKNIPKGCRITAVILAVFCMASFFYGAYKIVESVINWIWN